MEDHSNFLKKVFDMVDTEGRDLSQLSSIILDDGRFYISSELVTDDDGFMHFIVSDSEEELLDRNIQTKVSEV